MVTRRWRRRQYDELCGAVRGGGCFQTEGEVCFKSMGSGVPGVLQPGHDGLVTYCLRLGVDRGDGCFQTVRDVCFKSMGSSVPAGTGLWRATVWGAVPMCGVGLPSLWGSSVRTAQSRVRGAF